MKKKFTTLFAILLCVFTSQAQWSLSGNAGTDPMFNFIGTTDAQPVIFRMNNVWAGILDNQKYNTSFGAEALIGAPYGFGSHNTAMGFQAMLFHLNGEQNVALGSWALRDQTTGYTNTAVGYGALGINV